MKLVSVLLPTYNHEKFIEECLLSVEKQTYSNIEIVIGDDCSTDNTRAVINQFLRHTSRKIVVKESPKNQGITRNCNNILSSCSGDYLALFSGDDVWFPEKIEKQVAVLERNPTASLCFTFTEVFASDTGDTLRIAPNLEKILGAQSILDQTFWLGECGASFLIPKWAVPPKGFNTRIPSASDWYFWIQVAAEGEILCIKEVLTRYRKHSKGASNDIRVDLDHIIALEEVVLNYPGLKREATLLALKKIEYYYKRVRSRLEGSYL